MRRALLVLTIGFIGLVASTSAADNPNTAKPNGNRLTYLDEPCNPWYPHRDFPKLTTPMWVGEEGVEAVVILGIDDMRGHEKWEAYLRPILNRLKQIDGRAPVSIFTCSIDPKQPHLQQWLEEGLSFEVHTIDHPCPLLGGMKGQGLRTEGQGQNKTQEADAAALASQPSALSLSKSTVDRCIDLLNEVPNNKPVCFRMPCCDSLNTLSPRFYTEIFNKTTAKGNFLLANSSVMQVFTSADPALPRELVLESDDATRRTGGVSPLVDGTTADANPTRGLTPPVRQDGLHERFKKYLPADRFFANSIENYPYPFVVDRLCWEFPCVAPSDWAAQHLHKPNNPQTIEDWKAALDCTVIKQGVFCLVFHPHNWIKPEQINELIDHAVTKHGKKVKFLNFREAVERLNKNVLSGMPLRLIQGFEDDFDLPFAKDRPFVSENRSVWLADLNNDGWLDVNAHVEQWVRTQITDKATGVTKTAEEISPRSWSKVWLPEERRWSAPIVRERSDRTAKRPSDDAPYWRGARDLAPRFGCNGPDAVLKLDMTMSHIPNEGFRLSQIVHEFRKRSWNDVPILTDTVRRLEGFGHPREIRDLGIRLRDLDGDGVSELIVASPQQSAIFQWTAKEDAWVKLSFTLPGPRWLVRMLGREVERGAWNPIIVDDDTGVRFIDLNVDGHDDIVFSNHKQYGIWLWESMETGWSREVLSGQRGDKPAEQELPPIVRADGSNNGFWVHARQLVWMNEDTAKSKDLVERRSFDELLAKGQGARAEGQGQDTKQSARPSPLSPQPSANPDGPKSPEASLKLMQVKPGYRVELVAAEPLVRDPVAFDWGPDGKLWVAEMADYPLGVPEGEEGGSRIEEGGSKTPLNPQSSILNPRPHKLGGGRVRFLEDTDGDGKYDKSTVFLDKLNFPNGVMPWRDGVLISAAPEVLFARDTNGDGRADEVKILLTGFGEGNQQHRVNGFSWGLDNMVHCANGDSGGIIRGAGFQPAKAGQVENLPHIDIRGRDFRWNPDTGEIDPTSGQTQFGRNRDDFGNWFGNNNANPMYHFVLDDFYTRRNPHVAPPDPKKHVSINPGPSPVFPISRTLSRFNDFAMANRFTSANSAMVYRDELLFGGRREKAEGQGLRGEGNTKDNSAARPSPLNPWPSAHVFISEPVHNLVHHEIMTADGVTFTSRRADDEQQSEFLASRDNWFRPTQIKTGPDGALYIADMYRQVIEHPQYIPPALQEKLDLRAGHDKGRIYRVMPSDGLLYYSSVWPPDKASDQQLVDLLSSSNGMVRDLAHRLLFWKYASHVMNAKDDAETPKGLNNNDQDRAVRRDAAVVLLRWIVQKGSTSLGRLHALFAT